MAEPFIGEIRMVAFGFAPRNWALCAGQLLSISQNQALFSLLGTTYGGNGTSTFALPNLQGRMPIHRTSLYSQGSTGGEESHTLVRNEVPSHTHPVYASSLGPAQPGPSAGAWPTGGALTPYAATSDGSTMAGGALGVTSANAHENRPPFLVINFIIALYGIFPSRS